MDIRLIKLFNVALTDDEKVDIQKITSLAARRGYIVHPDCCTTSVLTFLKNCPENYNSTFYRTWADVQSKNRLELLVDQILHYASTYGTDFQGEVYCPNGEPIEIEYQKYTIISPITKPELYQKCIDMINAGIALNTDTLDALVQFIFLRVKQDNYEIDLDAIKNREAMTILSAQLNIYPNDGVNIVRSLYYQVFHSSTMIMDNANIHMLHVCPPRITLNLSQQQIIALSEVFLRYKKFLLTFKAVKENRPIINKIRNLAKKNHKPMHIGFWEGFTNNYNFTDEEVDAEIDKLDNNFKIAKLLQMFQMRRLMNKYNTNRTFAIRNGKFWFEKNSGPVRYDTRWDKVQVKLICKLVQNLNNNIMKLYGKQTIYVKFPQNLVLTCPVSEKMFVGNVPYGSSMPFNADNSYVGIYWRNEWGAHDLDLSFLSEDGSKYGWDGSYVNQKNNIVYSGDMTNADPEATELLLFKKSQQIPNGLIHVNVYSGQNPKYHVFAGQGAWDGDRKGYMVDPNTIELNVEDTLNCKDEMFGAICSNRLYFYKFNMSNNRTSKMQDYTIDLIKSIEVTTRTFTQLKPILLASNCIEYTDKYAQMGIEPDLDLTQLNKDTLIKLFS